MKNSRSLAVRLQVLIERLKVTESRLLLQAVKNAETIIKDVLSGNDVGELSRLQLNKLIQLGSQKFKFEGDSLISSHRNSISEFAIFQAELEGKLWGKGVPLSKDEAVRHALTSPLGIEGPDRGRTVEEYIDNWWKNVTSSIFGSVRRGAFEKKSNSQLRKDILGTHNAQYKNGLIDSLKRNAVATSNTAVQHVFSSVREALLIREGYSVVWSALFEKNVCARCRNLDGHVFPPGVGPRSPLHHSCRCIMEPLIGSAEQANMNSYYEWLKEQPENVIAEAIGVTRAKLLMHGGISSTRFAELQLDRKFEPLTITELRAIAPSIFAAAGL